jgi:redox-sensing transcriptional repressor
VSQKQVKSRGGVPSKATAFRLSQYLRVLSSEADATGRMPSSTLAKAVGVSDAQVRRDLAAVGQPGLRGVGYDVEHLTQAIRQTLVIHRPWRAVLVGTGNLARALLKYRGFQKQGFEIVGLFDVDANIVGQCIDAMIVMNVETLPSRVKSLRAELGVITVPAEAAQDVAARLVAAGVRGILNFAPTMVRTPANVSVVSVDLSIQFEQLAFQVGQVHDQQHKQTD